MSTLVVADVELAAAEKLPELRRALRDGALLLVAAAAALAAAGAFTWFLVRLLDEVVSGWPAPLVVAFGWLATALLVALTLRRGAAGARGAFGDRLREELGGLAIEGELCTGAHRERSAACCAFRAIVPRAANTSRSSNVTTWYVSMFHP